jgi:hypothetical protein
MVMKTSFEINAASAVCLRSKRQSRPVWGGLLLLFLATALFRASSNIPDRTITLM